MTRGRRVLDCALAQTENNEPENNMKKPNIAKELEATAQFIAAAPKMAEALEAALVGLESDILYCERHPDSHSTTHEGMLAHKRKRLNDAKAALTAAGYEF